MKRAHVLIGVGILLCAALAPGALSHYWLRVMTHVFMEGNIRGFGEKPDYFA